MAALVGNLHGRRDSAIIAEDYAPGNLRFLISYAAAEQSDELAHAMDAFCGFHASKSNAGRQARLEAEA